VQIESAVPALQAPRHALKLEIGLADFCDAEHGGRVMVAVPGLETARPFDYAQGRLRGTLSWVKSTD